MALPTVTEPDMRVISLGGGTQSSVLTYMAGLGHLDFMPDVAIYADTGDDPPEVDAMVAWLADNVPFEVVVVRQPVDIVTGLRESVDPKGHPIGNPVPTFTINTETGKEGQALRFCTKNWKTVPVEREIRRRFGVSRMPRGVTVEMMYGFTYDEAGRMFDPRNKWQTHRYPLIDMMMRRSDCQPWWDEHAPSDAPPLPRSACVMCPFHTKREWIDLKRLHPERVQRVADAEAEFQRVQDERGYGHIRHHLHRSHKPLLEAIAADEADAFANPTLFDGGDGCGGEHCFT